MAPTKSRESKNTIQEDRIHRALEEWRLEGTSFRKLAAKYGVPSSTLSERERGGLTRREGHAHRQKLTPDMEKALEDWCIQLDDWGFPPRMDLLDAIGRFCKRSVHYKRPSRGDELGMAGSNCEM
jgi:hypothetical protein